MPGVVSVEPELDSQSPKAELDGARKVKFSAEESKFESRRLINMVVERTELRMCFQHRKKGLTKCWTEKLGFILET